MNYKNIIRKIFLRHKNVILKHVEDLTPEEIQKIRLQTIRDAIHKAVDMGLYDKDVREIK